MTLSKPIWVPERSHFVLRRKLEPSLKWAAPDIGCILFSMKQSVRISNLCSLSNQMDLSAPEGCLRKAKKHYQRRKSGLVTASYLLLSLISPWKKTTIT